MNVIYKPQIADFIFPLQFQQLIDRKLRMKSRCYSYRIQDKVTLSHLARSMEAVSISNFMHLLTVAARKDPIVSPNNLTIARQA